MIRPAQDNSETILLVEDHLVLLELIKHILGNAGFTVLPACNAKEALLLEAGHPGTIDLLLSDEELARRKAAWVKPAPKFTSGWLARYARQVSSAASGAVLE